MCFIFYRNSLTLWSSQVFCFPDGVDNVLFIIVSSVAFPKEVKVKWCTQSACLKGEPVVLSLHFY